MDARPRPSGALRPKNREIHPNRNLGVQLVVEIGAMLRTLVAFLPDSMMVLVIMVIGLCLMLGLLTPSRAKNWVACVILLLLAAPFIDSALDMLPTWLLFVLLLLGLCIVLRFVAALILGQEGASHMMGVLAADVVRGVFKLGLVLALLPFRMLRSAWRATR
jgi:hypothetical protein